MGSMACAVLSIVLLKLFSATARRSWSAAPSMLCPYTHRGRPLGDQSYVPVVVIDLGLITFFSLRQLRLINYRFLHSILSHQVILYYYQAQSRTIVCFFRTEQYSIANHNSRDYHTQSLLLLPPLP